MKTDKTKVVSTAIDIAYLSIRDSIFSFKYLPGYHLKEIELAKMMGISRTPLRVAFKRLISEGLVEIMPNGRCHVADITTDEVDTLFEVTAVLESMCARLCTTNITESQLNILKQIQVRLDNVSDDNDVEFLKENAKFHSLIHEISGSKYLIRLIKQIKNVPVLFYLKGGTHVGHKEVNHQHHDIIYAFEKRDPKLAEITMRLHIEKLRSEFSDILYRKG